MPKVHAARGGKAPYELFGTTEELFGERLDDFADVRVIGTVEDVGRKFVVSGRITCTKRFTCDRCLSETQSAQVHTFAEDFDKSAVEDDSIDVTDLLRDELLAAQPIQNLCKTDCKGLCPKCGANLNEGDCGCDTFSADPRLAALEELKFS